MKRIISHGGNDIDIDIAPNEAVCLVLRAAAGCSSKSRAWAWAEDSLSIVEEFFPEVLPEFKEALGNGRYPDTQEALSLFLK